MQLSTLPLAVAALLLAGQTTAVKCTTGTVYCGNTLFNMGWNWQAVRRNVITDWHAQKSKTAIKNELFGCMQGSLIQDKLMYLTTCYNGCVDGGAGKNDYCK